MPQGSQKCPAVLLGCNVESIAQQGQRIGGDRLRLFNRFGARFLLLGTRFLVFRFLAGHQVLSVHEQVAGVYEGTRGGFLADAHYEEPFFTNAGSQAGVIAVAGDQAETIHPAGVQNVHGVDDHGAVGGVLTDCKAELLDGLNGEGVQHVLPAAHIGGSPVAVNAADGHETVLAGFSQHFFQEGGLGVITIDQDSNPAPAGNVI